MILIKILFVTIVFTINVSSLLSKTRDNQAILPNADIEVLEELDDTLYDDLIEELPILTQIFSGNRKNNSLRLNKEVLPLTYQRGTGPVSFPPTAPAAHSAVLANYAASSANRSKRISLTASWSTVYTHVISCYWCGLNDSLIPRSSICHDAFDSQNAQARRMQRFFRARCFYYDGYRSYYRQIVPLFEWPAEFDWGTDSGLRIDIFGPFMNGCFKRFVDVGTLYTSRGCRGRITPWRSYTKSFTSHRFEKLEIIARGHSDVCVHSPHASLTPFSRAISLFVRYHVCVCGTWYCNGGGSFFLAPLLLPSFWILNK